MMRKYVSLKLQHKTYVDDTTKTYERDLQIKNCAFYFILACVQTSPLPEKKAGEETTPPLPFFLRKGDVCTLAILY